MDAALGAARELCRGSRLACRRSGCRRQDSGARCTGLRAGCASARRVSRHPQFSTLWLADAFRESVPSHATGARRNFRCATNEHSGGTCAKRRSEEHTSELQSLMRISYAVFCLKKKKKKTKKKKPQEQYNTKN